MAHGLAFYWHVTESPPIVRKRTGGVSDFGHSPLRNAFLPAWHTLCFSINDNFKDRT
ncbi:MULTISPECIES: hypothetical protein [unclassified Bacteroides]|uniref:hypothetical protein n=1 Tax=unclassified Bacteroides TaxID=2646097 RepID=UPI00131421E7|nr:MULTISPECIES: hypothetical protein [unclassified Bacteroides]